MLNSLGRILAREPRHAENADARMDIRRHDPDHESPDRDKRGDDDKPAFGDYDNAVVSVESLQTFLENFLRSLQEEARGDARATTADGIDRSEDIPGAVSPSVNPPSNPLANPQAAHVAGLYKNTAQKTTPATQHGDLTQAQTRLLGGEDVRVIYALLEDLQTLQARGIVQLTIMRGETFLASLAAAARRVLDS